MSNAAKLKKKAVELEQKKLLDKALPLYIQFLQESDASIDDVDIPLYNRVGDLLLRTGNASDALNYYEKAVDFYAERGFLNNAIALCNKVLRQSPGRASIYYKLGKISATKGFKSDAKKNFLEYADRMQKVGQIDEAFRALKEFADLCPDQDDIRLMLAEQLSKENRQGEALEQLQKLHDKLDSEGRMAEARATVDRMKSIDPEAIPRASGSHRPQKSQDLIFLDTSFEQASRGRKAEPPAAATGRQVSDPDLVMLTLADQTALPVSPVHNAAVADAFTLDIDTPGGVSSADPVPMLDVDATLGSASEPVVFETIVDGDTADARAESTVSPAMDLDAEGDDALAPPVAEDITFDAPSDPRPLAIEAPPAPVPVEMVIDRPSYGSGPPLGIDYAGDLAGDVADVTLPDSSDLFDFRAPPRSDDAVALPAMGLDPDVAFPSFDLEGTALPSADDITSGASLAAALGADQTLGVDEPFGADLGPLDALPGAESLAEGLNFEPLSSGRPDAVGPLDLEWSAAVVAPPASTPVSAADDGLDGLELDDDMAAAANASPNATGSVAQNKTPADVATRRFESSAEAIGDSATELPIEAFAPTPAEPVNAVAPNVAEWMAPDADRSGARRTTERDLVEPDLVEPDLVASTAASADRQPEAPANDQPAVPVAPQADRAAGWDVQRSHAEGLLEAGDRTGGVEELEAVAAELERIGDLERSLSIVDELIRMLPDSVGHHQKRVELAFRSSDRVKLIDAYLELGDALFRSGEERKARAVYQRVFELAPDDPRTRAAVESGASVPISTASGSVPAIPKPQMQPDEPEARHPVAPPRAPDTHVAYQSVSGHGNRPGGGVPTPPSTRKLSPLDRSAASSDFVDLGEWVRSGENPKSTRMVAEEKPPTGDEQADFQEMLKRFKQGVAANVEEEDYESHYDLGVAYKEMGLIDEAVAEFQKALRGSTHRVRTYEALGQCFVEKEQYQVAASVLGRAIALGDGDDHHLVGVLYLLGRSIEALNKPIDALDYYQRVFAVDIEFRDVAERISAIEGKAT
jgi:tetratricopeptide (TPR) repeat protein